MAMGGADIYGPSIGQTPPVYFHCDTEEQAWEKFDRWIVKQGKIRWGDRAKKAKLLKRGKSWTEIHRKEAV